MQKIRRVSATVTTLRRGASIRRTTGKADTLLINGSAVRARYALKQGAHCAPPSFQFWAPSSRGSTQRGSSHCTIKRPAPYLTVGMVGSP